MVGATTGSIIRSTEAARLTQTGLRQIDTAARLVEILRLRARRTHGRTRATVNSPLRRTGQTRRTGNNRAMRIALAEAGTVSGTAAFPAVVLRAAVGPLAAARAATTAAALEPAAHGDLRAWAPAAAARGAAADGAGRPVMREEQHMRSVTPSTFPVKLVLAFQVAAALLCALTTFVQAAPQTKSTPAPTSQASQLSFASPKEAADALIKAAADYDVPALMQILGPDGETIISSADAVQDKNSATSFVAQAKEKTSVATDPKSSKQAVLRVGNEDWPFPIPIVNRAGKWQFDTKAGLQEILFRRIGTNE